MVNYDPVLDTVISDQEVIYKEEKTKLYYITLSGLYQSDIAGRLENNRTQGLPKWGCSHGKKSACWIAGKILILVKIRGELFFNGKLNQVLIRGYALSCGEL